MNIRSPIQLYPSVEFLCFGSKRKLGTMAYCGAFHFTLLLEAWLSQAIKILSKRHLFWSKIFIFRLLSISRKGNRAPYLNHTTVRVGLEDLPAQSLVCSSCLSSRYSQVARPKLCTLSKFGQLFHC